MVPNAWCGSSCYAMFVAKYNMDTGALLWVVSVTGELHDKVRMEASVGATVTPTPHSRASH